jgi:hypothetical protein
VEVEALVVGSSVVAAARAVAVLAGEAVVLLGGERVALVEVEV